MFTAFKDRLSDVSFETMSSDAPLPAEVYNHSKSSLGSSQKLNLSGQILLTPEVFSSPSHDSAPKNDITLRFSSPKSSNKDSEQNLMSLDDPSTPTHDVESRSLSYSRSNGCHSSTMYSPTCDKTTGTMQKPLHSAGSSPSLEVQEILTKNLGRKLFASLYLRFILNRIDDDDDNDSDDSVQDPLFLVEGEHKAIGEFSCENSGDLLNNIIGYVIKKIDENYVKMNNLILILVFIQT